MAYEYGKLLGRMKEKRITQKKLAEMLNISHEALSKKLNNKTPFKQDEMIKVCEFLDINLQDIQTYFFTLIVQGN